MSAPSAPGGAGLDLAGLSARIQARPRRVLQAQRRASVLVPLVQGDGGLDLLLTRRTTTTGTHQGQVAFPGGRAEPEDRDHIATALREAEEEVALSAQHVQVLGSLDDFPTVDERIAVTPVLGFVPRLPALRPQPTEVARIFTVPLRLLYEPARWRSELHAWRGGRWPVYYFDYDGETLWGLSAYITRHLLALTEAGAAFRTAELERGALE